VCGREKGEEGKGGTEGEMKGSKIKILCTANKQTQAQTNHRKATKQTDMQTKNPK
jgi:hypothetical protein